MLEASLVAKKRLRSETKSATLTDPGTAGAIVAGIKGEVITIDFQAPLVRDLQNLESVISSLTDGSSLRKRSKGLLSSISSLSQDLISMRRSKVSLSEAAFGWGYMVGTNNEPEIPRPRVHGFSRDETTHLRPLLSSARTVLDAESTSSFVTAPVSVKSQDLARTTILLQERLPIRTVEDRAPDSVLPDSWDFSCILRITYRDQDFNAESGIFRFEEWAWRERSTYQILLATIEQHRKVIQATQHFGHTIRFYYGTFRIVGHDDDYYRKIDDLTILEDRITAGQPLETFVHLFDGLQYNEGALPSPSSNRAR